MIKFAVLTVSDSCFLGARKDESGPAIKKIIGANFEAELVGYDIVCDEKLQIKRKLLYYVNKLSVDLVLTTGGTGLSLRDVTPEATKEVIEKDIPGMVELIRMEGLKSTRYAALSRAICGIRANTLIVNLPGSLKGAKESLTALLGILPHAFDMIRGKGH